MSEPIITTLAQNPEYYPQTIELIEQGFGYSENQKFESDFAPLIHPHNHRNNYLLIDTEKKNVIGHIGVNLKHLKNQSLETPIALIGGIVIHPSYRGQKHFTPFFHQVLEKIENNVSFLILWSHLHTLYEKYGFYQAGTVLQTGYKDQLPIEITTQFEQTKFRHLSDDDLKQIASLYNNYYGLFNLSVERTQADWNIIQNMDSVDLYLSRSSEGKVTNYFCMNKGRDLTHIIFEVGTPPHKREKLLSLLKYNKLWLSPSDKEFVRQPKEYYLGLFKIGADNLFSDFINKWTQGFVSDLCKKETSVEFTFKETVHELSHQEFLTGIFGPSLLTEFKDFGWPLYISGLDSI